MNIKINFIILKNKIALIIIITLSLSILSMQNNNKIDADINNICLIEMLPNELLTLILEYVIYKDIDKYDNKILNIFYYKEILSIFKNIQNNIKNIALINKKFNKLKDNTINIFKLNFLSKLDKKQKKSLLFILIEQKALNKFTKVIINEIGLNKVQNINKAEIVFTNYASFNIKNNENLDIILNISQYILYLSILYNNLEIIKYLKENNANINIKDSFKFTWAATSNNLDIFKYLIENGADINTQNYFGIIPLISAAEKGKLDIVKYLLENGAHVNIKNYNGNTALILASEKGKLEVVKYLLENGAHANIKNRFGYTALDIAELNIKQLANYKEKKTYIDIVKLLSNLNKNNQTLKCSII